MNDAQDKPHVIRVEWSYAGDSLFLECSCGWDVRIEDESLDAINALADEHRRQPS